VSDLTMRYQARPRGFFLAAVAPHLARFARDVRHYSSPLFSLTRVAVVARETQSSLLAPAARWAMSSMTAALASVVTSPSWRLSETSLSSRRMILPERVLGSSGVKTIEAGRAIF